MPVDPKEKKRIADAQKFRETEAKAAAKRATARASNGPLHRHNRDEELLTDAFWAMSFTKGLKHSASSGLVADPTNAKALRTAIDNGKITDFTDTITVPAPLQGRRQWEAPTAGFVFDLQGPDAQAVTMPPAPALNTKDGTFDELTFEMAEVYELALLRDVPFSAFQAGSSNADMAAAIKRLNDLPYAIDGFPKKLPDLVTGSPRPRTKKGAPLTAQTAFRGASYGADVGPYLSQFMVIGSQDGPNTTSENQGKINYGAQFIDQRVRNATKQDWMITWRDWLDVQDGANVRFNDTLFAPGTRFIHTPRDLATFVHDDALYQAYLNACLILLGMGAPFDPGFAELAGAKLDKGKKAERFNNATGFALFGGPHILSLVTEVATRGLKAVRYQKFQNHLRLRPETLAARLARVSNIETLKEIKAVPEIAGQFGKMAKQLGPVLRAVQRHNIAMGGEELPLLPMAFQEGSPMHPAYGAGHATVAGACVTVLKAFFDTDAELTWKGGTVAFRAASDGGIPVQFITVDDGARLEMQEASEPLTLLGELNKLAANISIGRNMGGVHYFSEYYDSARMGEEIAVGMLEEQAHGYPNMSGKDADEFKLHLTPFDAKAANKKVEIVRGNRITKRDLRCE